MLMATALALLSVRGQVSFVGMMEHPVIEVTPDKSETGLDKIFVAIKSDNISNIKFKINIIQSVTRLWLY